MGETGSALEYLDRQVMPGIENLEFELDEIITPGEISPWVYPRKALQDSRMKLFRNLSER